MYSPQIGQSQSVDRSIQRWLSCMEIDMHTQQVCEIDERSRFYPVMGQTHLAMKEVLAQALTHTTDPSIVAMVYALLRVIIPQLAYIAVVPCPSLAAHGALFRGRLRATTQHAEHVLRFSAIQHVVLDRVVAESTCVPAIARRTLQLDIPLVMRATQSTNLIFGLRLPCLEFHVLVEW